MRGWCANELLKEKRDVFTAGSQTPKIPFHGSSEVYCRREPKASRGLEDVAKLLSLARIGQNRSGFIEEIIDVELDFDRARFLQAPFIGDHGVG